MKILEIGFYGSIFFEKDVTEEAQARGHQIDFCHADSLTVDLNQDKISLRAGNLDLTDYDLIHVGAVRSNRWPWFAALGYLNKKNSCSIIDRRIVENTLDQYSGLSKYIEQTEHKLLMPRSIVFKYVKHIEKRLEEFTFPVVVKTNTSSCGAGVMLAHSVEDISTFVSERRKKSRSIGFVLREFIPNNGDYRVTVIDGKAEVCLKRTPQTKGEFRSNISLGGLLTATDNEDVKEICRVAEEISNISKYDISGVDVMVHAKTGKPYILEVNRIPGDLQDDVAVSGVNIAKLIVDMYEKRVSEKREPSNS